MNDSSPGRSAPAAGQIPGSEPAAPASGSSSAVHAAPEREARRRVIAVELTVVGVFVVILIGVFVIGLVGIGPYAHGHL